MPAVTRRKSVCRFLSVAGCPRSGRDANHIPSSPTHRATKTIVSNMFVTGAQRVIATRSVKPTTIIAMPPAKAAAPSQNAALRKTAKEAASQTTASRHAAHAQ